MPVSGQPRIEVLGVHPVPISDEIRNRVWTERYGIPQLPEPHRSAAVANLEGELGSIFLLEVAVHQPREPFDPGKFREFCPSLPEANQQVAYMDVLLTPDCSRSLMSVDDAFRVVPELLDRTMRLAFFLHFFDPARPLETPWGQVALPAATPVPNRLAFMQYVPVD